jgi:hypothetical protein
MADFKVKLSSSKNFNAEFSPPTRDFTLKNTTVNATRLDGLTDVQEVDAAKVDGAILVYDADNDIYVLRDILSYNLDSNAFVVDGGSEFD